MSNPLGTAIAALRDAVASERPTMFWDEAMKHVAVLLEHVQKLSSDLNSEEETHG
ncbi:MAG: hypothetical protein Q8R10_14135 [Pseudomonas sp.]|uniref:hypothetical protein n=1 Tax=Pseudomonas sp. TaxID=306 RepID=UPI00273610F9|nr:hypothetical protein [Pseudomonas sp.]MDP3847553.1 hypothetical protein [Pseudomonas sp.]